MRHQLLVAFTFVVFLIASTTITTADVTDGLMAYSKIIGDSKPYLSQAGKLILELDPELLSGVMAIAEEKNYTVENVVKDLGLNDRVIVLSR